MVRLRAEGVWKGYVSGGSRVEVLKGLTLEAHEGEMVMIMGPSGSGKTTLLNILGGIDVPDAGTVEVDGERVSDMDARQLSAFRRSGVGFIFQFYNLIPTLSALENVVLGMEASGRRKGTEERASRYLSMVGLEDKADRFPQELSGGEQQRVAIARALAKEPVIVLADEPTGNVDEALENDIMGMMQGLQRDLGMTFFIVSHNTRLMRFMDRTLRLEGGRLREVEG